jgi:hypothetical protein
MINKTLQPNVLKTHDSPPTSTFVFYSLVHCIHLELNSRTTLIEALCFPFDKVFGGLLLGDMLSVSTLIGFKLQ